MGETLAKPVTEKHTTTYETSLVKVGICGMQGWRKNMEDSYAAQINLQGDRRQAAFGIYDGHNGHGVAKYCGGHMVETLLGQPEFGKRKYKEAWSQAYIGLDESLSHKPDFTDGGCTANSVLIAPNGHLYCANAGDSRSILVTKDGSVRCALSSDHKPTTPSEVARIQKAGATVEQGRVNGLSLSRAIGDFGYRCEPGIPLKDQAISCIPDVSDTKLTPKEDRYIILACDGIWDVLTNEDCASFVHAKLKEMKGDIGLVVEALLDHCCADVAPGAGTDNMSVIVVEFKDEYWKHKE